MRLLGRRQNFLANSSVLIAPRAEGSGLTKQYLAGLAGFEESVLRP
jgi:hypothetical protein